MSISEIKPVERKWYILQMIGAAMRIDRPKNRKSLIRYLKQYLASTDITTKEISEVLDATVISMVEFTEDKTI
jgi:hypothetical protein